MNGINDLADSWPAVSALLDEALALPAASRQPWLDGLSDSPPAVRQAVQTLLAAHARAESGDFMGTLPKLPGAPPSGGADNSIEPAAGDLIGGYRLLAPLGRGGMGVVWRAERAEGPLRREVALKLPRLAWGGAVAQRLARERDILATLAHPNIARLYDAGVDEQGRPFIAMELVDGMPIDAYCTSRALPLRERLGLLLQVAAAVAHAHAKLVVHRDLKPANILVTPDGQVRLLDFGIAKLMDGDATAETALTRQAGQALTLDYASPEQIRGEPLGTASDVYSLAVVAYELLAGRKPYVLKRASAAQLEDAIASMDPPPASVAASDPAAKKQLRGDLDAILQQALRKDPARRTGSVDAFAQDIRQFLAGLPVQARPDTRWYRLRKFVLRNRLPVAAASTATLALVAGSGVAGWQAVVARREAQRVVQALAQQEGVQQLYAETLTTVSNWEPSALAERGAVMRLLREKGNQLVQTQYKDRPIQTLGILQALAAQLSFAGHHDEALEVGARHLALLKASGGETREILLAHVTRGRTLHHLGRYDESEAVGRAGMAWAPDEDSDAEVARARAVLAGDLGALLSRQGKRAEAEAVLSQAEAVAARSFPEERDRYSIVHRLAQHHVGFDDAKALSLVQRAHDGYLKAGVEISDLSYSLSNLGAALSAAGQPAGAVPVLRDAVQRNQELFGAFDRDTLRAVGRLAAALAGQGQHDAARTLLAERRAALRQAAESPDVRGGLVIMQGRLLENEMLLGDLQAATPFVGPLDTTVLADPAVRDAATYIVMEARSLIWRGRTDEALQRLKAMEGALPAGQRQGPTAFALAAASTEALLAVGQDAAALQRANGLQADMTKSGATATWLYRVSAEQSAIASARAGRRDVALRLLDVGASVAAPSAVERAESALRRAEVLRLAGRTAEARASAQNALTDLAGQHSQSPRLLQAQRLLQAG